MPVDVKICGLKTPEALDAAVAGGAAYAGFVFFPESPRALAIGEAARLAKPVRGKIQLVALTVDADDRLLEEIAATLRPDFFQFHGSETRGQIAAARERFGIPVIKAVKIGGKGDIAAALAFADTADMLLFDAKPNPGEGLGLPGGNGIAFDWRLLTGVKPAVPALLSGGLDADNVAMAIELSGLGAVDVSSGVESAPGVKDPGRIAAFLAAAKAVEGVPA